MKLSGLVEEFKAFAFKGNMIDLAVAVVIGGAFGDIIKAIVGDIIMPLIALVTGILHVPTDYQAWQFHGFLIGHLLGAIINFLLIAAAVFFVIVKLLGAVMKMTARKKAETPAEPVSKECPMCLSIIPIKAIKCAALHG